MTESINEPKYTLTVYRKPENQTILNLCRLSDGLAWKPTIPEVYLAKDPATENLFLVATDGKVIRTQRVVMFWVEGTARMAISEQGPCIPDSPIVVVIHGDMDQPLPDLSKNPLKLCVRMPNISGSGKSKSWEWGFSSFPKDVSQAPTASVLLSHLRPAPDTFRSWLVVVSPAALSNFCATFPEDLEPSMHLVPEPQTDGQDLTLGTTWAKYWVYNAANGDQLGVIMGVRSRALAKRYAPKN